MTSLVRFVTVVALAVAASLLPATGSVSPSAAETAGGTTVSYLVLNRHTGDAIDLTRPAMHTSGTFGTDDAEILVVLSLHPVGTSYNESAERVTNLTRVIYLASRASGL